MVSSARQQPPSVETEKGDDQLFGQPMTEEQSRRLGSGLETDQETGRTLTPTERWEADASRPKPEPTAPAKAVSPPTGPVTKNPKAPTAQPAATPAASTGGLPTIENVPTSRIAVRPGLFQARDVTAGGSYDEERVRQITGNWNPERFDPLSVVADPEKPGSYFVIGGHHRLEAVRRLGLETVPVRVLAGDINVPGERRRLEREAVVSNFGVAETNLREKVNAAGRLADSGMDQVQVAREMRLRRGEAERLLWLRRLPPGMLERVMVQPELAPAAAELGRAVDRHGMGPETVQGLFTRWDREYEETGHIPGQYVLRQQLDGLAAANRGPEGEQTGFGGLEGFGGDVVLTRFDAERHTAEDLRRKVRGTQQRLTSCEALAQELGVEIGDVKEAAQTRLDVLTAEQEASVRRTLTLHRAEASGEPPPQPAERPQPAETLEERREAAVARRREMRQPLSASTPTQPQAIAAEAPALPVGQQSVLGDGFATNRTLSMEMPSFDKGAKAGPMATPPAPSDPRQTALEPPPDLQPRAPASTSALSAPGQPEPTATTGPITVSWQSPNKVRPVLELVQPEDFEDRLSKARRELREATKNRDRASSKRRDLPPGSSRARVTTANANWTSAAERLLDAEYRLAAYEAVAGHKLSGPSENQNSTGAPSTAVSETPPQPVQAEAILNPPPRRTRPRPQPLRDAPAESRKPPAEEKAKGTATTKRSKPRQAPPLAKPPKKAAGKSRDTMPAAMRRMLRGL